MTREREFMLRQKQIRKLSKKPPVIGKFPITCKCGKYRGKRKQGKLCGRCQTKVTFKMEHKNEQNKEI